MLIFNFFFVFFFFQEKVTETKKAKKEENGDGDNDAENDDEEVDGEDEEGKDQQFLLVLTVATISYLLRPTDVLHSLTKRLRIDSYNWSQHKICSYFSDSSRPIS